MESFFLPQKKAKTDDNDGDEEEIGGSIGDKIRKDWEDVKFLMESVDLEHINKNVSVIIKVIREILKVIDTEIKEALHYALLKGLIEDTAGSVSAQRRVLQIFCKDFTLYNDSKI